MKDGREMRVRGARPRDAGSPARLVESVARDPQPTLLVLPWKSTTRLWRRRVEAAGLDFRSLYVVGMVNGVEKPSLGVFPENTRALAFYERHGFAREGYRRAHYRRGEQYHDEVLMARFVPTVS